MPIRWDKRNKRWRYEFDRYVQGSRKRSSRLLPKGWSQAEADAFDRAEGARLYAVATGIRDDDPAIDLAVTLYLTDKRGLKSHRQAVEHLNAIRELYTGRRMSELAAVAEDIHKKRSKATRKKESAEQPAEPLADATIRQRLSLLKAACRWAWKRHGLVKADPTQGMVLPTVRNESHVYRGRADMLRACRACTHREARMCIRLAFYTGMRLGEILRALPSGDVLLLEDTKNGDRRAIPVHPRIAHLLRFMPFSVPKITVQRAWERTRDKTGLVGTFHDWRHSAASEMVNAGVDLYTVGAILGHRDARSTKRYSHLNTDTLAAAIGKIGGRKVPHKDRPKAA